MTEGESIMSNIIVGYRITNLLENLCSSLFFYFSVNIPNDILQQLYMPYNFDNWEYV